MKTPCPRLSEQQHHVLGLARMNATGRVRLDNRHAVRTSNALAAMGLGDVYWRDYSRWFEINDAGRAAHEAYK